MTEGVDYTTFESLQRRPRRRRRHLHDRDHARRATERYTTVEGRGGDDKLYVKTIDGPTTGRAATAPRRSRHRTWSRPARAPTSSSVGTLRARARSARSTRSSGCSRSRAAAAARDLAVRRRHRRRRQEHRLAVDATTLAGLGMTLTPFGTRPGPSSRSSRCRNAVDGRFTLTVGAQHDDRARLRRDPGRGPRRARGAARRRRQRDVVARRRHLRRHLLGALAGQRRLGPRRRSGA